LLLIFTLELLLFFLLVHLFSFSYFSSGVVLTSVFYMCNAGEINNSLHLTNYGEGILAIFQLLSTLLVRFYQKLTVKIGLRFFRFKLEFL